MRGGKTKRQTKDDKEDIWKGYDPQKVKDALAKYAGSWSDVDADELIARIHRAREEGSRSADRP